MLDDWRLLHCTLSFIPPGLLYARLLSYLLDSSYADKLIMSRVWTWEPLLRQILRMTVRMCMVASIAP